MYSQRDSRWKDVPLGFSKTTTIGSHGCTITCIAELVHKTPIEVNDRLKAVNGFANENLVVWSKLHEAYQELTFIKRVYSIDGLSQAIREQGFCMIEVDSDSDLRTDGKHWLIATAGFDGLKDPLVGKIVPESDYPIVTGYSVIKVDAMVKNGDRIKLKDNPTVYLLENDTKRPYASEEAFFEEGGDFTKVKIVERDVLDSFPTGVPIISRYQHVINSLGKETIKKIFVDGDELSPDQLLLERRDTIDGYISQIGILREEKTNIDSKYRTIKQEVDTYKSTITKMNSEVKALNADIGKKTKEIKTLNEEVIKKQDEITKLNTEYSQEISKARETIIQYEQSANQSVKTIEDLHDIITKNIDEILELKKKIKDLSEQAIPSTYRHIIGSIYIKV